MSKMADDLRNLKSLFDEGILTEAEFAQEKARILGSPGSLTEPATPAPGPQAAPSVGWTARISSWTEESKMASSHPTIEVLMTPPGGDANSTVILRYTQKTNWIGQCYEHIHINGNEVWKRMYRGPDVADGEAGTFSFIYQGQKIRALIYRSIRKTGYTAKLLCRPYEALGGGGHGHRSVQPILSVGHGSTFHGLALRSCSVQTWQAQGPRPRSRQAEIRTFERSVELLTGIRRLTPGAQRGSDGYRLSVQRN